LWVQIALFVVSGVICLITTKPFFERILKSAPSQKTNVDLLIGKNAVVLEDIDNLNENGAVKVDGKVWSARNADSDTVIPAGTQIIVREIKGVKLMCSIKNKEN